MNQGNRSGNPPDAERLAAAESLPLLTTKLYRPPVTPDLEQRTRLLERLMRNRHRPLTLISAPAGYGKTMLASMWLEACNCPTAWVSLDETDNHLQSFTSYLLAALHTVSPTLELRTRSLLEASVLPLAPVLARYLINDVEQIPEPFILALDDVHLIEEQDVLDLLSELLRHPSRAMSLVLIGRRDPPLPVASLRAHQQVTEIRAADLRFTPQETARLLGNLLNREIDGATAAEWTQRTEGWVTGLLLAALSLRQWHETDDVRFAIPEHSPYLQDYLLTEVLSRLSPARRDWLLLASLPDRFCAPLCEILRPSDAATEETDLTGIGCIRWLQDENLFLVPLDNRDEWFRFHHLFQQLLQDRVGDYLEPEAIAAAHRRAINWFAEKGFIEEAIQHALAAGDVQAAVQFVEQHRYDLMNREQWHRLERWLNLLPDGAVTQSPLLVCTRVHIATYRGQDSEIISSLHRAEHLLTSLTPGTVEYEIVQSEIAVVSAVSDIVERQPAQAINRAQSSLEQLPQQALHIRAMAIGAYAVGLQMQGELEQGAAAIRDALAKRAWPEGLQAKMMHYLCVAFDHEGDLASVLTSARAGLWIAEELSVPETLSACRYYLGVAHYVRDELTKAESYLQALLEDRATSTPLYLANGGFFLALIYQAQGRTADAARVIDLLEDYFRETKHSHALAFTTAFRVELTLRQRDLAEARLLSEGVDFEGRLPIWFLYVPHLTPVKLLLAEGTAESLTEAKTRLAVLEAEMRRIHRKNALIEALALQALVYDALGDEPAATEKLAVALALAEPGGFIRTFVDLGDAMAGVLRRYRHESTADRSDAFYVDRILAAFPEAATGDRQLATVRAITGPSSPAALTAAEGLIEPLTERESQVLVLLAQRLTYKEIGAQLFISPGTVSQHAVRIYKKLQVNNRRQAVVKAQALGLLPPP